MSFATAAGNKLDSLLQVFNTTKNFENKYSVALRLGKELFNQNKDSSLLFFNYAQNEYQKYKTNKKLTSYYYYLKSYFLSEDYELEKSVKYCDSCILYCSTSDLELQKADCFFSKAVSLYYLGKNELAASYFKIAIPIYLKKNIIKKAVNGYSNIIGIYQDIYPPDTCEVYFKKAIKLVDKSSNCQTIVNLYSNLGASYIKAAKNQNALGFFLTALKYAEECKVNKLQVLRNIGSVFINLNNYDKAEKYLKESYKLACDSKIEFEILESTSILALYYENLNDFKSSLLILEPSKEYIDTVNLLSSSANLCKHLSWSYSESNQLNKAIYYAKLYHRLAIKSEIELEISNALEQRGHIYYKNKKYKNAIKDYSEGLEISRKLKNIVNIKNFYQSLYRVYSESKDYANAIKYSILFINLNDSLVNAQNTKLNSELEAKYKAEKRESEIKLLNEKSKNQQLEIGKSHQQKIVLFVGLLLTALVLGIVIYNFIQKKKANKLLNEKNELIQQQKHLVEEHQKEILDSIHYAKRIQNTLLAHHDFLNENLPTNFVYFQPKDIVSGDFYWATKHDDNFYLAVCDSTGHGVPGAFMSLLNIGFLNEAINEKNILEPHKIFDYVRKRLVESISKEGQKDGFDGILLRIDKSTNQITYSAANNAPILISNENIIELPKDRMPVGKGEKINEFTLHTINAKTGDILYLYTDGYADQFGGPKGKKFKYKTLNELLLANSTTPIQIQKEKLNTEFQNWKGTLEQVDDVCVIGIKI